VLAPSANAANTTFPPGPGATDAGRGQKLGAGDQPRLGPAFAWGIGLHVEPPDIRKAASLTAAKTGSAGAGIELCLHHLFWA